MKTFSTYKSLIYFVLITYFLSGICWGISTKLLQSTENQSYASVFMTLGNFMPSIVGICLIVFSTKGNAFRASSIIDALNVKPILYVFSLTLMPLVTWIAYLLGSTFHNVTFESILLPLILPSIWPILILIPFFVIVQGPLGEEFGWRKFMLSNLLQHLPAFHASIVVGLVWSLWHAPKFFMANTIQFELATTHGYPMTLIGYTVYTLCLSLIMTILFIQSKQKLMTALLFHAMANFSHGLITILTQPFGAMWILLLTLCVTVLLWITQKRWLSSS